jgi:hypothetical protein
MSSVDILSIGSFRYRHVPSPYERNNVAAATLSATAPAMVENDAASDGPSGVLCAAQVIIDTEQSELGDDLPVAKLNSALFELRFVVERAADVGALIGTQGAVRKELERASGASFHTLPPSEQKMFFFLFFFSLFFSLVCVGR